MQKLTTIRPVYLVATLALCVHSIALAKVDLVTLPKQDGVQVTIYNSADLTLVRDTRSLTLKKGVNRLNHVGDRHVNRLNGIAVVMTPTEIAGVGSQDLDATDYVHQQ